jgi:predicted O-methyltransferase YrrM
MAQQADQGPERTRAFDEIIDEALQSNRVRDDGGKEYELHSNISRAEGEFLRRLISDRPVSRSMEIGCAYGISSLYICSVLARAGTGSHVIIDPYQFTQWHGIGVGNLRRAGFAQFTLIEEPSEIALPELLREGSVFDFAFIDGWHTFDHALVDFFYIDRLLRTGGLVAFDDVDYPAVRKLMRYVSRYPHYRVVDALSRPAVLSRAMKERIFLGLARLVDALPADWRTLFDDAALRPDGYLGLNTSMMAFEKTGDDARSWDWYAAF